jgi:hypothetical protein
MGPADIRARLAKIAERFEWMEDNLWGCDWCCGGGDEEATELEKEQRLLERQLAKATVNEEGLDDTYDWAAENQDLVHRAAARRQSGYDW